ncbi:MAG: sialate O-acetylesterase [Clostridia bacterium]|nr:sialate O-acetylesterase [Clostridia bacterium]
MMQSFLLVGQSNMAGRGFLKEVEPIQSKRVFVLKNGRWQPVFYPVNYDRPFAGVNLAESFAEAYAEEYGVDVGLIPCADGGTSIEQWREGGVFFDHAVLQAQLAQRTSELAGILWHQGEQDASDWNADYEEKCAQVLTAMRKRLDPTEKLPVLMGELGEYLANVASTPLAKNFPKIYEALAKDFPLVNRAIDAIAKKYENFAVVSAKGLTSNPDFLHFNAKSLREFGLRYYAEFKRIRGEKLARGAGQSPVDGLREMEKL